MIDVCPKCGKLHDLSPLTACPGERLDDRVEQERRKADRSDRADEIFAGLWERHGRPHIEAAERMRPFADLFENIAREWFRRGYSRGGQDGAGVLARSILGDLAAVLESGEHKDQNSG